MKKRRNEWYRVMYCVQKPGFLWIQCFSLYRSPPFLEANNNLWHDIANKITYRNNNNNYSKNYRWRISTWSYWSTSFDLFLVNYMYLCVELKFLAYISQNILNGMIDGMLCTPTWNDVIWYAVPIIATFNSVWSDVMCSPIDMYLFTSVNQNTHSEFFWFD